MLFVKDDLMRVQHWITAVLSSILLLSSSESSFAQGAPPYYQQMNGMSMRGQIPQSIAYGPAPSPGMYAGEPGLFPQQGGFAPSYSPLPMNPPGQAGFHQGMLPWPNVSQFHDPRFTELHHTNGLWNLDSNSSGRNFFGNVQWLSTTVKKPDGFIGQAGAQSYKEIALPIIHPETNTVFDLEDLADAFQGDVPNRGGVPRPRYLDFNNDGNPIGFFPNRGEPGFRYYDAANARDMGQPNGNGLRVSWGFDEADGTGFVVDGWWTGNNEADYIGAELVNRPFLQPSVLQTFLDSELGFFTNLAPFNDIEVLMHSLKNLNGLPVNDGTLQQLNDGRYLGGTTIPYDLEFDLKFKSRTAGTSMNVLMMPIFKTKNVRVRPLIGARYMHLQESFHFFGSDSGLSYDDRALNDPIFPQLKLHSLPNNIDDDGDGFVDNPAIIEDTLGGQGAQAGVARVLRLDLIADLLGVEHPGAYQAFIDNESITNLIGPEIGLQYDIGGKRFKLRGHTKVALLGNFEKMKLKGNNIGEANNIAGFVDLTNPLVPVFDFIQDSPIITPTDENPNPNAFSDEINNSHVSPMIEQSLFLDIPAFEFVPFLKDKHAFEQAKVTLGWTFTFVAEVLRPSESIIYNANPRAGLFPSLESKRGNWWTSNLSLGVEIPY